MPRLPPLIDGVGDYAWLLAHHLRLSHNINTRFLVCSVPPRESLCDGVFPVEFLPDNSAVHLRDYLARSQEMVDAVILQFVGYAYQKRGCPLWLLAALQALPKAQLTLITTFHELYASGPPWGSAFYLSHLQRWIARQLLLHSSTAVTSTRNMAMRLQAMGSTPVLLQPIPSNIPTSEREPRLKSAAGPWAVIVFGRTATRQKVLKSQGKLLLELHRRGLLQKLVLAGDGASPDSPEYHSIQSLVPLSLVEFAGALPAGEVADKFASVDFCLSCYEAQSACKSGAMMAAFANGCPVILADGRDSEPLVRGKHFLVCDGTPSSIAVLVAEMHQGRLTIVSTAASEWYDRNASWAVAAANIAKLIPSGGQKLSTSAGCHSSVSN